MNEQEIKELQERIAKLEEKNTSLEEKFSALEKQVDTVSKFVSAITESQSIETAMNEIESVTKQLTNCDTAKFYCYDNSNDKFFSHGDYRDWQDTQSAEELKKVFVGQKIQHKDKSAAIPVITSKGKSMGVIIAQKENGFKKSDFEGLKKGSQIMNTVELALKKELEHQGRIKDELTGLKNRQGLNEYLANTLCGNLQSGKSASIIMCDIDHFKSVNDTYGHEAGDKILKAVAAVLNDGTRDGADSAFRIGGEEMVCILNCDHEKAIEIADRLREQVENTIHSISINGEPKDIKVTVSMGICDIRPDMEITPENTREIFDADLSRADKSLYAAKENGRNQIAVYDNRIFNSYLADKAANLLCGGNNEQIQNVKNSLINMLNSNSNENIEKVVNILQKFSENNPLVSNIADNLISKISLNNKYIVPEQNETAKSPDRTQSKQQSGKSEVKYYNKEEFSKIQNKEYIPVTAANAYKIAQRAAAENIQFSIKYNGDNSVVTLDGVKDKHFAESVKREFAQKQEKKTEIDYSTDFSAYEMPYTEVPYENAPNDIPPQQPEPQPTDLPQKKGPTFYNKEEYSNINNKTFISTDSKTAYDISKYAEKNGVQFSAKFNGKDSAVTVDGVKNKSFIETVKRISAWSDKVQIKAAQSREQHQNRGKTNQRGR